ncbi:putative tRNA (uracil-O(2)-)-methyltransferase [Rhynchocyon petersi]
MAEVGRVPVRDPGARLPEGFWAAVAVWLERPQVANKRLCGARLEARRRAVLPRSEARRPRPNAGQETGPESGREPPDDRLNVRRRAAPGLSAGPEPEEAGSDPRWAPPEACPAPTPRAGPQPGTGGDVGRPGGAGVGDGGGAAAAQAAFWDDFSRSLASGGEELLAFLDRSEAGPQDLDLVLRSIIPKASSQCPLATPRREVVVHDVQSGAVTFLPLEEDAQGSIEIKLSNVYQIRLRHSPQEWFMSVLIFCPERWQSDGVVYPKPTWLGKQLLAKLATWSVEDKKGQFKNTLSLISIAKYSRVYQELKEKYKDLVRVWPEVTDPEKFVYEDVAIAAYLLVLWEEERAEQGLLEKQSFVDLGCGNGLLTHILCSAGHPGRGIDVRRRRIWALFGSGTQLEEGAVTPGDKNLFPDVDWLIGNHSDELTPWIPVIAARSSYRCRFFVLPCCFFSFVGKYPRRQSHKTQYRAYLDFVAQAAQACGFLVEEDCLRIPSTKRVCLVGRSRTYPATEEASVDKQRTLYIQSHGGPLGPPCPRSSPPPPGVQDSGAEPEPVAPTPPPPEVLWVPSFRPREKLERVRNCATLPRDFLDKVVLQVARQLLGRTQDSTSHGEPPDIVAGKPWNQGGSLSLAEVASELDKETLQRLKAECGGLQTLLRNHHQVFSVRNGRVHLRDWREEQARGLPRPGPGRGAQTFKTRPCWFFTHHPDGCALPAARCPFAHGPEELRPGWSERRTRQPLLPEAAQPTEA